MLINPFTGQVLNANPEGHNQYWNPNGPSADFSLPLKPSISPGSLSRGLAKRRSREAIRLLKVASRAPGTSLDKFMSKMTGVDADSRVAEEAKDQLERLRSSRKPSKHALVAKKLRDIYENEEFLMVDEADALKRLSGANQRAADAYAVAKKIRSRRNASSGQFVKKSGDLIPVQPFNQPFWTPREYPEPD